MTKIPTDVERLMWLVAESDDPQAVKDFESRFPAFAPELARRRMMVSNLKSAGSHRTPPSRIPAFAPSEVAHRAPSRTLWITGGLALAALAFATYSVSRYSNNPKPALPPVERVNITTPTVPETNVYTPPKSTVEPSLDPAPTKVDPVPYRSADQEPRRDLRLSNISLEAALRMIGQAAGYQVQIAPGFKDQQVSVDFSGATTTEMLRDLGTRYGFTPFDQGDGTIIIVPAVDSGPPGNTDEPQPRIGG